jgi:hypothetical protein
MHLFTNSFIKITVSVCLFYLSSCSQNEIENPPTTIQKAEFTSKIITIADSAFGYQILKNNKVYIHQPYIPVITGNHHFKTKRDAESCCNLVILKLNKGIVPPTILLNELDSLKIKLKN